jgi:hypothetical protein
MCTSLLADALKVKGCALRYKTGRNQPIHNDVCLIEDLPGALSSAPPP